MMLSLPKYLLLMLVRLYQLCISPLLGPKCRFYPTCSSYAIEAIQEYGAARGGMMAALRLSKCHPWHTGGFDPVPKKSDSSSSATTCGCNHS